MSSTNQTAGHSTDNFTAIFNVAINKYWRLTGKHLDTHPFAAQLDPCQSPEAISNVLRTQAQAFRRFREGEERLMKWLDPTIHILCTLSDALGQGIDLVGNLVICTSDIQVLVILTGETDLYRDRNSSQSMIFPQSFIARFA